MSWPAGDGRRLLHGLSYGVALVAAACADLDVVTPVFGSIALVVGLAMWANPRRADVGRTVVRLACLELALVLTGIAVAHHRSVTPATRVVRAIERFHDDRGAFPRTLAELVPKYLPEVPRTCLSITRRNVFVLLISAAGDRFALAYQAIGPVVRVYDSRSRRWQLDF
jgi:hypothetical protein